jgi:hypothetical protein
MFRSGRLGELTGNVPHSVVIRNASELIPIKVRNVKVKAHDKNKTAA